MVSFELWGQKFMAISAGPVFKFNPSISFLVNFDPLYFDPVPDQKQNAANGIDRIWKALSEGGRVLMPLDNYPFSEKFGWVEDRYGLSWQLMLTSTQGEPRPPIIPSMLFVGDNCGKTEEAIKYYTSLFQNSQTGNMVRYGAGQEPDKEGTVMFADFMLENSWFMAMDSAHDHQFGFNEALSFMVNCASQEEIDHYWQNLSAVPEAEQCGWLKDKYGVSWQIVPSEMKQMMQNGTEEQIARVTKAFLQMKKFDLEVLRKTFDGE